MQQTRKQNNKPPTERLIIVSNRLPLAIEKGADKQWQASPSSGGLITALTPILRNRDGVWLGWHGTLEDVNINKLLAASGKKLGYKLKPIALTEEEFRQYYLGFSNEVIWPLFHDLQSHCNFDPAYWVSYQSVNRTFARVTAANVRDNDYIWVHDYHLMLMAKELRAIGAKQKIGFFLHTPFPPPDIFIKLPWRLQILEALLEYDLIGLQTMHDRNNFIHCVESLIKGSHFDSRRQIATASRAGHEVKIGSFPISIDFKEFAHQALRKETRERASQINESFHNCQLILGVDRLDYSKGILQKLLAFRNALERFSDLRGKISLIQIVVPSRETIPAYQGLKTEIEGLVSEINGKFTQPGWIPIHYIFRTLGRSELLAYYRAAEIGLVTPLKDGMNLVAKEYCAANTDKNGVLILSEFAGAATQKRRHEIQVNPFCITKRVKGVST
ncbi:MAG: trehalose-6-phosphate synthase, partial [Dehalococcoidia bacterium]|nr:trehalose-6-phosphate synthase [Dehalococcoidia bacterium]